MKEEIFVYTVIFLDHYDCNYGEKAFLSETEARTTFKELVHKYFNMDKRKEDSWGNKFDECLKLEEAFFGDNENHGEIYISLRSYKLR